MAIDLCKHYNRLKCQLDQLNLPENEYAYRLKNLEESMTESSGVYGISNRFFNLAHEIQSATFLQNMGHLECASDSDSQAGCDFCFENIYQIESVCSSCGKADKSVLYDFIVNPSNNGALIDYHKKEEFLFSRITSVLSEKLDFYRRHLECKTISSQKPYIVFVGLGELAWDMILDHAGSDFLGILWGRDRPTVVENIDTGKIIYEGYTYRSSFPKRSNGSPIPCNLFENPDYFPISGILISGATLGEPYTSANTWLFLNPNASIQVQPEHFPGIIYWSTNSDGKYYPHRVAEISPAFQSIFSASDNNSFWEEFNNMLIGFSQQLR